MLEEYKVSEESYKGYTIEIIQDPDPVNPRAEFDHLGIMAFRPLRRYNLGDEILELEDLTRLNSDRSVIKLNVYIYDHSGITIQTRPFYDPWDSGFLGLIYVDKSKVREEWKVRRITKKTLETVLSCLEGEVKEYDSYLTGSVYGYNVKNSEGEDLDSCWGFYGLDYCLEEGKSIVNYYEGLKFKESQELTGMEE